MHIDPKVEPWLRSLLEGVENSNHGAEVVASTAYSAVMADAALTVRDRNAHDALVKGGSAINSIIEQAQILLRMYLEPGEHRIQTPKQTVSALLGLFDGPKQREAQQQWHTAINLNREIPR